MMMMIAGYMLFFFTNSQNRSSNLRTLKTTHREKKHDKVDGIRARAGEDIECDQQEKYLGLNTVVSSLLRCLKEGAGDEAYP
jgi:hypothetical protein